MKSVGIVGVFILILVGLILLSSTAYLINERQQVIITQFGKPVGLPITEPGLHFKAPFLQKVHRFERRFLEWDGDRDQLPTKDKRFIWVDTYARWRITDPLQFFKRLKDNRGAILRLDDILDGETRNTIARHNLIDIVRDSNREFQVVAEYADDEVSTGIQSIEVGRTTMEAEVLRQAQSRVSDLGIEVLDFRFKRVNYVKEVRTEVYARMIAERNRIAEKFRSEGEGEAARISGEKDRELKKITSQAYRTAQEIKGRADARASDVYASAYNSDPEFYAFLKSMDVLRDTLDAKTTLLLGTDGDLMRYMERAK